MSRKKLAIISTYNESCGNASYTHVLKKQFETQYDVEVIALDLFVLQKSGGFFAKLGDKHIESICRKLKTFDYVNIQFEAGLYGNNAGDIERRVKMLIDAAPNLIFTMHRIDLVEPGMVGAVISAVRKVRFAPIFGHYMRNSFARLYSRLIRYCKEQSRVKNVWLKVHTRREKRIVNEIFDFANCIDFPLAFLNPEERQAALNDINPGRLRQKYSLPENAKIMGAFGYISNYKGFDALIRALAELPPEWHLLLVGSQHPQSVRPYVSIDPYLGSLIELIQTADQGRVREIDNLIHIREGGEKVAISPQMLKHISERVRFVGNVDDDEFVHMLRNSDAVVLPYLEVGQSMSGVLVLAIEAGARMFAANNLSFNEARRYFGDVFGRFDIGNHLEIAQKVQFAQDDYARTRDVAFEKYNIVESVALQCACFEGRR
jgi:glycosyltransferase involved in cell wall biosynthesis